MRIFIKILLSIIVIVGFSVVFSLMKHASIYGALPYAAMGGLLILIWYRTFIPKKSK